MFCLQQGCGLAGEALEVEDALYESQALRDFVGIDLSRESVLDATAANVNDPMKRREVEVAARA